MHTEGYFFILSVTLKFPDICGRVKYPKEKNTAKRYKDWYDEYIGKYEQCLCEDCKNNPMPYLNGEGVYSLTNYLLQSRYS